MKRDHFHPPKIFEPLEPRLNASAPPVPGLSQQVAQLTQARWMPTAVTIGHKTLIAGGLIHGSFSGTVDTYDGSGNLANSGSLSQPRSAIVSAAVNGKAVFAGGETSTGATTAVDIYSANTGMWSSAQLSEPRLSPFIAVVVNKIIIGGGSTNGPSAGFDLYDSSTGSWKRLRAPEGLWSEVAVVGRVAYILGTVKGSTTILAFDSKTDSLRVVHIANLIRASDIAAVGQDLLLIDSTDARIYVQDTTNGRVSVVSLPMALTLTAIKALGTDVVLSGDNGSGPTTDVFNETTNGISAFPGVGDGQSPVNIGANIIFFRADSSTVDVFDSRAGAFLQSSLAGARSGFATAVNGASVIVAGGATGVTENSFTPSATVDIFTDTAPTPVLSGGLAGSANSRDIVTVLNTGDADLASGYTIQLYASPDRTLNNVTLLGSLNVASPLTAGNSAKFRIRSVISKGMPAGTYHLLAALQDSSGHITPIAAEDAIFRVHSSSANIAVARPSAARPGLFSTTRIGGFKG